MIKDFTKRFQNTINSFGVEIRSFSDDKWEETANGYSFCPFCSGLGIVWASKEIWHREDVVIHWATIIHELGHLVACKKPPKESNEFEFLGWEYLMVKHLKYSVKEWMRELADYSVGRPGAKSDKMYDATIGELTPSEWKIVLRDRLEFARNNGLADGMKPLQVR